VIFDLNEFLQGVSNVLDIIETDIFGVPTNHSKRIAVFSNRLAWELDLSREIQYDLVALSILHDNGASLKILHDNLLGDAKSKQNIVESRKEHCIIGERNISTFPFLTAPSKVVLYHHEKYDGSGFFGLTGDEIPLMAQLINFADTLDLRFDLGHVYENDDLRETIVDFIEKHIGKDFSKDIAELALQAISQDNFWENLSDEKIDEVLQSTIPSYKREMGYKEIHAVTKIFSLIIDAKSEFTEHHSSGLTKLVIQMCKFYEIHGDELWKLTIASDLHDLGKLGISNLILDKPGALTEEEFSIIKEHPTTAKLSLEKVQGFADISEWAYNHHEKLNGTGYPRGLQAEALDFNSRLLTCLDIYQALGEKRPYRDAMNHDESMKIMKQMVDEGLIDAKITEDIENVLRDLNIFNEIS